MTTTKVQLAQPSNGAVTHSPDRRQPGEDSMTRFRQTLTAGAARSDADPRANVELRSSMRLQPEREPAPDTDRRDTNTNIAATGMTVGSMHYSMPFVEAAPAPANSAGSADTARLIEQATSIMVERASRADANRFIVSLDHAIVGGASAEFVRDGAFLHVRLLARNDAAYRSMWTHKDELQQRLSASTGLVTRVEILEGFGDGRSA